MNQFEYNFIDKRLPQSGRLHFGAYQARIFLPVGYIGYQVESITKQHCILFWGVGGGETVNLLLCKLKNCSALLNVSSFCSVFVEKKMKVISVTSTKRQAAAEQQTLFSPLG